jgi:methylglutamate dehydrogenase subunit D
VSDHSMQLRRQEAASLALLDFDPHVSAEVRPGLTIAHLSCRKGQHGSVSQRIREHLKMDLPLSQSASFGGRFALLGLTPMNYLLVAESLGPSWVWEWSPSLSDCCAVSDQTGAFAVLRLTGPRVPDVLSRGMFLDFDTTAFPVGRVAATLLSHFNAIVWRLPGESVFDLAVPRSFVRDSCRWLSERSRMAGP